MFRSLGAAALALALGACATVTPARSLTGTWSAPSLSRPDQPIIFVLHSDGSASEHVADYHGRGRWETRGRTAWITWDSGWTGLLRPAPRGGHELLTWRRDHPLSSPADDRQPAVRLSAAGDQGR